MQVSADEIGQIVENSSGDIRNAIEMLHLIGQSSRAIFPSK